MSRRWFGVAQVSQPCSRKMWAEREKKLSLERASKEYVQELLGALPRGAKALRSRR